LANLAEIDIDKTLAELKDAAASATNEEEFKINAERIIHDNVITKLGLQSVRYEYTLVSGGRIDALYGKLILEYKAPGTLSKGSSQARAKEQIIGYIKKEAGVEEAYASYLGVILCDKMAFVRYKLETREWVLREPYELNRETIIRLVEALRGLRRKKLDVDELLKDFGPNSALTKKVVEALYRKVLEAKKPKTQTLFNDWKKVFSQVCAYDADKLAELEKEYCLEGEVDYEVLLFSIHTHYAFLMKRARARVRIGRMRDDAKIATPKSATKRQTSLCIFDTRSI
jgi:hypothetical protein